jgi:hypothetical protein
MVINKSAALEAFNSRTDLKKYGVDALLLFALQLKFGIEDIDIVASTSLTEGCSDKKADLIYIDDGNIVIAQAYMATKTYGKDGKLKKEAPSAKASDLNTAISWLFSRPINEIPEELKPHADEIRQALQNNIIKHIQFWYVHNLPESINVQEELITVEHAVHANIKAQFNNILIPDIQGIEVGLSTLEEWYNSISTPILVTDEITVPIPGGFQLSDANWELYATAVQARWLYDLYKKYGTNLLSANVREYLGSRVVDNNINNGIRCTARDKPEHFLVFNNGITALTNRFNPILHNKAKASHLTFNGISIVNGAQTIGAIGNLESPPNDKAMVQIRFIKCNNPETVQDIVRFNNSQNKIAAPDFRSNDPIQRRLTEEFKSIPEMVYVARRGGLSDIIQRQTGNSLPSVTAGQALAAFHGEPGIAYHEKTHMWEDDNLYSTYFNSQTTAKHILFAYSLLKSVEIKKLNLINKSKDNSLLDLEKAQLEFFRKRGAIFLLASAISRCIEIIVNKPIPNLFNLSFKSNCNLDNAINNWSPIVEAASAFTAPLADGLADGFKTHEIVDKSITTFRSLLASTRQANAPLYLCFTKTLNE